MFSSSLVVVLSVVVVDVVFCLPTPQLTEQEFRSRGRSLEGPEEEKNVVMISNYRQVRVQGGRSINSPIDFPTLTVKSPDQLSSEGASSRQVSLNLANPVFTQTEDAYIEEQKLVEEEEEDNIEEEMEMEEIEEENKTESTPVTDLEVLVIEEVAQDYSTTDVADVTEAATESSEAAEVTTGAAEIRDLDALELNADGDNELFPDLSMNIIALEAEAEEVKAEEEILEAVEDIMEAVEGSGAGNIVEAGLEIEEVLTEVPNIDFGDIQEV